MKIKNIKGIADKLPNMEYYFSMPQDIPEEVAEHLKKEHNYQAKIFDRAKDKLLSTDIDLQDIVEIDVDGIYDILEKELQSIFKYSEIDGIAQAIAKSGCIRWRSNEPR